MTTKKQLFIINNYLTNKLKTMKIYSYRKCKLTNDNLIAISELNNVFTAFTFSQSKSFKTLSTAKKWLSARGYETIISIEIIE